MKELSQRGLRILLLSLLPALLAGARGRAMPGQSENAISGQAPVLQIRSFAGMAATALAASRSETEFQGTPAGRNRNDGAGRGTQPVIRVSSTLVTVPVSVTDASGRPVHDLVTEAFRIEEEGRPQQVVSLGGPGETPVDLALLVDVSASVRERFQFEKAAARRFLNSLLQSEDTVSVFSIGLEPKLVQPRTSDASRAAAAVTALEPTAQATAFFDAVVDAARHLGTWDGPGTRRVLVVISDGEDNYSNLHTLQGALSALLRSDSLFYSINPSGPALWLNRISARGQQAMEVLALETGGAFVVDAFEDLERTLGQIAGELRAQYLLGYYRQEAGSDGQFRRIAVTVPGRPDLHVRARRGYYARSASGN